MGSAEGPKNARTFVSSSFPWYITESPSTKRAALPALCDKAVITRFAQFPLFNYGQKVGKKGIKSLSQSIPVCPQVSVGAGGSSPQPASTFLDDKPLICLTLQCPENATFHIYEYKQGYYLYLSNI